MATLPAKLILPVLPHFINEAGKPLESDERLTCVDMICEGPVEGLVDKDGDLLKFISDNDDDLVDSLILGKGTYYKNVPLIDSRFNKLNFVTAGFNISYGSEINNFKNQYPSTVHRYNQKLYLSETDVFDNTFKSAGAGIFSFYQDEQNNLFDDSDGVPDNDFKKFILENQNFSVGGVLAVGSLAQTLEEAKKNCIDFNHKIVNKYADEISIHIRLDNLFETNSTGSTIASNGLFVIEFTQDNSNFKYTVLLKTIGISKAGYTINIPLTLNLDQVLNNNYYIKVYCLNTKIAPTNGTIFKDFKLSAIVERIVNKGSFSYPLTALVKSSVSSRHFNEDPERTFDMKMLKIKVPNNYDPEIREYNGNWNGKFENFLRWTDNPAWIFYDICTNSRYGVGNGLVFDKDINKWDLYKIGKYCDELIKIGTPSKYASDDFYIDKDNTNIIYILGKGRTLESFKIQYPPVFDLDKQFSILNGGFQNSILFLYDLKNGIESFDVAHKKIIWSVEEVKKGDSAYFKIKLINDFGVRKFLESDNTGLLNYFCEQYIFPIDNNKPLKDRISEGVKNTQNNAKSFVLENMANSIATYSTFIEKQIFDDSFYRDKEDGDSILLYGKCLPKVLGYRDPFEHRFSCNTIIDSEVEALKVLNDLASVFRGITYYKNNEITSTIDVAKPISYFFNNSNVKNGVFSYSSASLEGNHTVAKVLYKDRYENFTEQVEIVEDFEMIKNYGIIIKEILGFGITSKDQARRIGQWLLLTNRFENQGVTFSVDLQGLYLRPGDIIQIEDQYKNDNVLQGRVVDVDYDSKFIVVDRQLNLNLIGQKIKFIRVNESKTNQDLNNLESVSDSDIEATATNKVIELKIERIENNSSRIYFSADYNFNLFNSILKTAPFIIENSKSNQQENLYKVVSISEIEANEYQIFSIKYAKEKYEALTINAFDYPSLYSNNSIAYSTTDTINEIDLMGLYTDNNTFYSRDKKTLAQISGIDVDYYFNEQKTSLKKSTSALQQYDVVKIKCVEIFNKINSSSDSYYKNIKNVFNAGGGILFKLILRNQNLKFYVTSNDVADKTIFMGEIGTNAVDLSNQAEIRSYLVDKTHKIINV